MPRTYAEDTVPPAQALARLREGNRRFVAGEGSALRDWHPGLTEGQRPFAIILGCADSRAPAEYVFDQGLGDLFVIRVAGNIIAPSLVGSVEYAVGNLGTRLVVVMGHTQCGAVSATVHALEHGGQPESPHIQAIVDFISPHVRELFDGKDDHGTHEERIEQSERLNALASARELRNSSEYLRGLIEEGRIQIVSALYELATGKVTFLEEE